MPRFLILIVLMTCSTLPLAAQSVRDSVRMDLKMYSYHLESSCGAGIYATWPNVLQELLGSEDRTYGYSSYGRVATDGMYIPYGYGEQKSTPETGIVVPEGHLAHNPQIAGAAWGAKPDCSKTVAAVMARLGGAEGLLNASPFRITEWYATYSIPAGTLIALFEWEQTEGLDVAFDGGFPLSRKVDVDGKKPVVEYEWATGDGATYSTASFTHTYSEPGTYTVTLTVTDDDGETAERTEKVTVSSVVLEYSVIAPPLVKVGDTLGVTVGIKNVGTEKAVTVSVRQAFARVPSYPESSSVNSSNADAEATESIGDTTTTDLAPGEEFWAYQFYVVTKNAYERIEGKNYPVPVDWKMTAIDVRGTDADGNPATVRDLCLEQSCTDETRIPVSSMTVDMLSTRIDGETTTVKSGLDRWTSAIYPNGVFYHLVPPLSLEPECNSGCLDLEIDATDEDGAPLEGAIIELSRVLLDTDPAGKSVVTPDQGGGIFCHENKCGKTLKLPPTGADGKWDVRFWVPGVIKPVDAYLKASATKAGYHTTEYEHKVVIQPTKVNLGQRTTATPNNGDMTAISMASGLNVAFGLPDLKAWCDKGLSWAAETDSKQAGLKLNWGLKKALKKGIDWTCGESLKKYIYDEEFARDDEIASRQDKLAIIGLFGKVTEVIGLYWFHGQFDLPMAGLGETSLTKSPPFLSHSSEFVDAVIEVNKAIAWQYFRTGSVPTISFDLYEVSHVKANGRSQNALYIMLSTKPDLDPKVDYKKLITKNYDKRIFLSQDRADAELATPASESDRSITVGGAGKHLAENDSTFDVGHVVLIDAGTEVEETVQIVAINGSTLDLSVPLKYNHGAGALVAYTDSAAVAPPDPPVNAGEMSGLPGAPVTPVLEWAPLDPAMSYAVEVATDTEFQNVVQAFTDLTEPRVTVDELEDRKRYYWRVRATNLLGQGEWSSWYSFFTGRPWGDDLSEARLVADEPGVVQFAWHFAATAEAAEAGSSCSAGDNSLWYRFVPATSRRVAFETFESGFNTALSIWTDADHPLTEVACNDDYENGDHPTIGQSYVEFDAETGTTYYIRVAGTDGEEGPLFLTLRAPTGVAVEERDPSLPDAFALSPAYPNPFNPSTTLELDVAEPDHFRIHVFDALGRMVSTLHDSPLNAGRHTLTFQSRGLPSGVYFVRVQSKAGLQAVRSMTLLE